MRPLIAAMLLLTLCGASAAAQLQAVRMQAVPNTTRLDPQMASLSPSLRAWVSTQARANLDSGADPDTDSIADAAQQRLAGQEFSKTDIDQLVQWVMMETARQADADLRDAMEQMRAANQQKARQREAAAAQKQSQAGVSAAARADYESRAQTRTVACVKAPCLPAMAATPPQPAQIRLVAPTGPNLASPPADSDQDKDSLSDMTETQQLRMQMLMDRRSKAMETLSNLMKKNADTQSAILSNLK